MSLPFRLRKIFKRSPIMENGVIVHELHVTGMKFHPEVQLRVVRYFVKQIERLQLGPAQLANPRKAARGFYILPLVNSRKQVPMPVEDRNREIRFLACRNFTASICFDCGEQDPEQVRPAPSYLIEHRRG